MKKQTRKTASKANFALHLFLLPPEPVPGTCCPEHPQHRPLCPSPWAPPGPFPSQPSAPTGAGGVFGEAPLCCDFHGKRAVTPCRQHPAPKPTQYSRSLCARSASPAPPVAHTCGARAAGDGGHLRLLFYFSLYFPMGSLLLLEEPQAPSPLSAAPGPPPGKGSFRSSDGGRWIDTWQVLLLLFIAPSLRSD